MTDNFNPHSREGSDKKLGRYHRLAVHFNPHSREGSDKFLMIFMIDCSISIHTPAKGVTDVNLELIWERKISIHTPAKGVTAILPNFRLYTL